MKSAVSLSLLATISASAVIVGAFVFGLDTDAAAIASQANAPALPAAQAAFLADGQVTYEELEGATANYLECMASRGYAAAPLQGEGLRPTVLLYTLPDSEGHDTNAVVRAAQATAQHCRLQHLDEVQAAYAAAHLRPSTSEIEQIYAWMEDCAAEGGPGPIDLPERAGMLYLHYFDAPSMNLTIAIEQADTWRACNWALQAETGFIAPPPPVR